MKERRIGNVEITTKIWIADCGGDIEIGINTINRHFFSIYLFYTLYAKAKGKKCR